MSSDPCLPEAGAPTTRRRFLLVIAPTALGLVGWACKKEEFSCNDVTGLQPADIEARKSLEYKERADKPELACSNCAQFVPPESSACATCRIMRGPIHPEGWCKVFAPKA